MSCPCYKKSTKSSNGNVQKMIETDPHVDFTLLTTNHINIKSGNKSHPIKMSLIKGRMKPAKGYGINLLIKGHKHRVEGASGRLVVVEVMRLYKENGIEISKLNVWFNANIYWLKQISIKHSYTTVDELMAIVGTPNLSDVKKKIKLPDPSPLDWGASAWLFLGAYIAQKDGFDFDYFETILDIFQEMLEDDFIGCEDCAIHFLHLKKSAKTQLEAAEFMFNTMNAINKLNDKPTLTWEQAVKRHRWENL